MQHPVQTYCERHNLPLYRLALRMGVASSTLSRLVRFERRPSPELMAKIEYATEGEVGAVDLFTAHFLPHRHSVCQDGTNSNNAQDESPAALQDNAGKAQAAA